MAAIRRVGSEASVDELAAEAGVSKPVLYAEFGGKEGIADALALELAQRGERAVIAQLANSPAVDAASGIRIAIEALLTLVGDEPEIYGFLVRAMRSSDRGLLDNALVRTLQSRVAMLTGLIAPGSDPALLKVLTHGTFGFVFAAFESWQTSHEPSREVLVDALTTIVLNGFVAVGSEVLRGT